MKNAIEIFNETKNNLKTAGYSMGTHFLGGEPSAYSDIMNTLRSYLSGKMVIIGGTMFSPTLQIEGESTIMELYGDNGFWDLRNYILPNGSNSTILNQGDYVLDSLGKLPIEANTKKMHNWMGDGLNSYVADDNF